MTNIFFLFNSIGNGGIERNARNISKGNFNSFVFAFKKQRSTALLNETINFSKLIKSLFENKKGIIYVQNFRLLLPAILFKFINRGKLIYHIPIGLRSGFIENIIYNFVFFFVDRIVVSTSKQKSNNKILNSLNKCIVQPYSMGAEFNLDIPYNKVLDLNKNIKFLFIGRIASQKGLDIFIKIIDSLNLEGLKCEGHVYGLNSNEKEYVESNLFAIDKSSNLFYHGECTVDPSLFDDYDSLLFTSRYEGYGILLAEALVSGIPILSSNCNFGPYDISNSGLYFNIIDDYEDVNKWVSLIKKKGNVRNNWDASDIYSLNNYMNKVMNFKN